MTTSCSFIPTIISEITGKKRPHAIPRDYPSSRVGPDHNPRCEPPWSDKELQHKVKSAVECPPKKTQGWLLESSREQQYTGVDISGIADKQPSGNKSRIQSLEARTDTNCSPDELENSSMTDTEKPSPIVIAKEIPASFETQEPGIVPIELLRVPGFISEVMDFCMSTAPYPNQVLAFCGALSLQSFLAARKVRDPGDNRTNLYLLGLAHSSAGKDWPRKLNTRIIYESGLADGLGEKFASGEGLQDSLYLTPSMLFQTDEIDGMLQAIRQSKEARYEMLMGTLMTLYTSSSSIYPLRRKANEDVGRSIDQPSLTIFGTAIPTHYYEALSHKMLSNGFFGRMFVVEAGPRGQGQEPTICALPPRVIDTARWWSDYRPTEGDIGNEHPKPTIIEQNTQAKRQLIETRLQADGEYSKAESQGDPVGTTVWGRVNEQARKLSLIYAISENPKTPCITLPAAQWASQLVMHQASRMLFQANLHVADNPFHAECLNVIQRLREMPDRRIPHSVLLKRMKMKAKDFKELIDTMIQRGDVVIDTTPSSGRPLIEYVLAEGARMI